MSWKSIKYGEHLPVFIIDCLWQSFSQHHMKHMINCDNGIKKILKLNGLLYLDIDEYNLIINKLEEQLLNGTTKKRMTAYDLRVKRLIIKIKSLISTNIKTKSTEYLNKIFIEVIEEYIAIISYFFIVNFTSERYKKQLIILFEKELHKKKKTELTANNCFEAINEYIILSFNKEKKQLLIIADNITKDSRLIKMFDKKTEQISEQIKKFRKIYSLLKKHNMQYCWINTDLSQSKDYTFEEIINSLKEQLIESPQQKIKELKHEIEQHKKAYNQINLNFKASKKIIKEFEQFENNKLQIEQLYFQLHYYLKIFLDEISKRHNLTHQELMQLTYREILGSIKLNLLNKDIIKNRENDHAIIIEDGKLKILTGYPIIRLKESFTNDDFIM